MQPVFKQSGIFLKSRVRRKKQMAEFKESIVLSLGGSIIVPNGGIDTKFLINFNKFIRRQVKKGRRFFIVCGGGATTRHYQKAGKEVIGHKLPNEDLDWLGIHATRLNAHLIRTIFKDIAHPRVVKHYEIILKVTEPVAVAAGWQPGWSTDYDAIVLCQDYGIRKVINLTNIKKVYTADPKKDPKARPIDKISFADYLKIAGTKWTPGMNIPFDPIAAKLAKKLGVKVIVLEGRNLPNLEAAIEGKNYEGTTIQ